MLCRPAAGAKNGVQRQARMPRRQRISSRAPRCFHTPIPPSSSRHGVVDNGSSHRGQACIDRLEDRWPTLRLIHLPVHASWLNQVEIYFSVVQRKVVSPNDFHSLSDVESRLLDFQQHYEQIATPVEMEVHQERSERATRAHRRPRSRRPHARCLTRPRMRHRNSEPDHQANTPAPRRGPMGASAGVLGASSALLSEYGKAVSREPPTEHPTTAEGGPAS